MVGYSVTPLVKKLGIRPGFSLLIINPPPNYWELLGELPPGIQIANEKNTHLDFIHYFEVSYKSLLKKLPHIEDHLEKNGMLWVSWPKGGSGIETDLNREIIRETLLKTRMVDVKVCSVDENWSGLKFVIRKELR